MSSRKLLAPICAAAIAATSITAIATYATAQVATNVGDCALTNETVVLEHCSNFFHVTGACTARVGRAFRVTGEENQGYFQVEHVLARGYVQRGKLDWVDASYCRAAGIRR